MVGRILPSVGVCVCVCVCAFWGLCTRQVHELEFELLHHVPPVALVAMSWLQLEFIL